MEKRVLSVEELEAQSVLELPDREVMKGLIRIITLAPITLLVVAIVKDVANKNFNDWDVDVLSGNEIEVEVGDVLSDNDVAVFCNQIVAVIAAQCFR